jgi:WD40 repeat protein
VRLWDPTTGHPVGDPLTGHTNAVTAAAAIPLPDRRTLLATTSDDATVRLWDPTTRTCLRRLPLTDTGVGLAALGTHLAITTRDGLLFLDLLPLLTVEDTPAANRQGRWRPSP